MAPSGLSLPVPLTERSRGKLALRPRKLCPPTFGGLGLVGSLLLHFRAGC